MDIETKEALEGVRAAVLEIDQKLSSHLQEPAPEAVHSKSSGEESPGTAEAQSTNSGPDSAKLTELESENETLKGRVAVLESETHVRQTIQDWLRGLTPEGYIELGTKLGYGDLLTEAVPEDDPDAMHEIALNDVPGQPIVRFSQTLPEGEDGWEKSETLGCFVKVE